ncbi:MULTISPECIES: hypothetical protein [unclassified Moraxella]|uniref:hypothetical protein n=1 Tax=unclassified Moraxella TaxID=2685852 RepID=UPI003AF7326F
MTNFRNDSKAVIYKVTPKRTSQVSVFCRTFKGTDYIDVFFDTDGRCSLTADHLDALKALKTVGAIVKYAKAHHVSDDVLFKISPTVTTDNEITESDANCGDIGLGVVASEGEALHEVINPPPVAVSDSTTSDTPIYSFCNQPKEKYCDICADKHYFAIKPPKSEAIV